MHRDGTTSTVILIGDLMRQAERYLGEGLHPRLLVEVRDGTPRVSTVPNHHLQGFEAAKRATLEFLETFKQPIDPTDREVLACVARTSLRTKVYAELAALLTDIVTDAVLTVQTPGEPIDLHMVRCDGTVAAFF